MIEPNFKKRRYDPLCDYEIIAAWGRDRGFPIIPPDHFPEFGIIVENYCVGFLYRTDSKIAWLEWVISNPNTDKVNRSNALDEMIRSLLKEAQDQGFKTVLSSCQSSSLIRRYTDNHGFLAGETGMTNMVKSL